MYLSRSVDLREFFDFPEFYDTPLGHVLKISKIFSPENDNIWRFSPEILKCQNISRDSREPDENMSTGRALVSSDEF